MEAPADAPESRPEAQFIRSRPTFSEPDLERRGIVVKLETSMGEIVIELDDAKAPQTVANFVTYVTDGHYDGTIFHRVIDGFMVQGGGMTAEMKEKSIRKAIPNEADNGLKNDPYTVAMARTPDPHSATAQFFINVKKNDFLNHTAKNPQGWGYAVFGKVVKGQGVVNKIKAVATGRKAGHDDVPLEPVVITRATLVETPPAG
jgi:peptidyl-prolyl cis-trans isomerase B (cyclophilin B)